VRVDGSPEDAAVLVRVLAGAPTPEDEKVLRAADRADVPVSVVQTGTGILDIPYVLATEVVMCSPGSGFPVGEIAQTVAARLGESGTGLAARLPVVREPLSEVLIEKFSRQNAIAAVAIFIPGADFPVLTLKQMRLVLRLGYRPGVGVDQEAWPGGVAHI